MKDCIEDRSSRRCIWLAILLVGGGCAAYLGLYLWRSELFCEFRDPEDKGPPIASNASDSAVLNTTTAN